MFLAVKGFSAQAIDCELVPVLSRDAIDFSSVTMSRWQRQLLAIPCRPSDEPATTTIHDAIRDALTKSHSLFVRSC
jgi:hypothetical protein